MSKSCQRIVIVLLIVLLLILSVSLYYVKSIATSLKEQGLQREKNRETDRRWPTHRSWPFFFYFKSDSVTFETDRVNLKGRVVDSDLLLRECRLFQRWLGTSFLSR